MEGRDGDGYGCKDAQRERDTRTVIINPPTPMRRLPSRACPSRLRAGRRVILQTPFLALCHPAEHVSRTLLGPGARGEGRARGGDGYKGRAARDWEQDIAPFCLRRDGDAELGGACPVSGFPSVRCGAVR